MATPRLRRRSRYRLGGWVRNRFGGRDLGPGTPPLGAATRDQARCRAERYVGSRQSGDLPMPPPFEPLNQSASRRRSRPSSGAGEARPRTRRLASGNWCCQPCLAEGGGQMSGRTPPRAGERRREPGRGDPRAGRVLAATCLSTLVVNANTSAVSILLPAISEDTGMDVTTLQWAVTGYRRGRGRHRDLGLARRRVRAQAGLPAHAAVRGVLHPDRPVVLRRSCDRRTRHTGRSGSDDPGVRTQPPLSGQHG